MKRTLNILKLLDKKSHFLFGARSVGKTFLIKEQLREEAPLIINLLESDLYLTLIENPSRLRDMVRASASPLVVIDEIQRIPELLNEIHNLIEDKSSNKPARKFLLTGSSARKLKTHDANLLGGRARKAELFPLTAQELMAENAFNLDRLLAFGGLPRIWLSEEPFEELRDYVEIYLNEEISREANIRNIPNFARFLNVAALSSGGVINYTKMGADAQLHPNTVREYFQILVDTLLGFIVPPWQSSKKRKAIQTSKFYLFDSGVTHALLRLPQVFPKTAEYGRAFEQLVAMELRAFLSYTRSLDELSFWRTLDQWEVDFVIGNHTAVEVKSTSKTTDHDRRNLEELQKERQLKNFYLVSLDPTVYKTASGVEHLPFEVFVQRLWKNQLF